MISVPRGIWFFDGFTIQSQSDYNIILDQISLCQCMDNGILSKDQWWSYNYDLSQFYWWFDPAFPAMMSSASPAVMMSSSFPSWLYSSGSQLRKDNTAAWYINLTFCDAQPLAFCIYMYCTCSNVRAWGTVCGYGGPILAETDGPGGSLVAGDHLFHDSPTYHTPGKRGALDRH